MFTNDNAGNALKINFSHILLYLSSIKYTKLNVGTFLFKI